MRPSPVARATFLLLVALLTVLLCGTPGPTGPGGVMTSGTTHPSGNPAAGFPAPIGAFPRPDTNPGYTTALWNVACADGGGGCVPQPPSAVKSAGVWDPTDNYTVFFGGAPTVTAPI